MNRAIEIHDSSLESMTLKDGYIVLHFSPVYIHGSEGIPGVDVGSVWVQDAYLKIGDAAVVGSFSELPCDMWTGYITLDGTLSDNMIAIPLDHQGSVELRLEGGSEIVSITGTSARLELVGDATYLEEFGP